MNIAVFGASGRMGKRVCDIAQKRGHTIFEVEKDKKVNGQQIDVVIDFSVPQATAEVCNFCITHHCNLVSGVTGRNEQQQKILDSAKNTIQIVEKSNFSKGIECVDQICKMLAQLKWDCDIVETHRKQKRDSPSGTAKHLATTITQNGTKIVTVHSIRAGSNFGKHEIIFATDGESITITHQAENLEIFALGAVETAEKIGHKK